MKVKKYLRSITLLVICIVMLQVTANAMDSDWTRSNAYITRTWATVERRSQGLLNISFDITGKGMMDELGATTAYLYENDGQNTKIVATFRYTDPEYADMMGGNSSYHSGNLPYTGTPGYKYYAVVYFRAGNSSGSGTTSYITSTVTALP